MVMVMVIQDMAVYLMQCDNHDIKSGYHCWFSTSPQRMFSNILWFLQLIILLSVRSRGIDNF